MNRASHHRSLIGAFFVLSLIGLLFGGVSQRAAASANPSGTAVKPWLIGQFDNATSTALTVMGHGFTPGGTVYLALYDQAGARLYEHRLVTASPTLSPYDATVVRPGSSEHVAAGPGGELSETFNGLCGASVMARALDETTDAWSSWLMVDSACAPAAEIADDMNSSLRLPVAPPSAYAIATGILGDPPILLDATDVAGGGASTITVAGIDFTAGHRVYLAIYDQMGAKLYPGRWITTSNEYTIGGMSDSASEAHPFVSKLTGVFHQSLHGLCGANVMIRAYDQSTETWSNWINLDVKC